MLHKPMNKNVYFLLVALLISIIAQWSLGFGVDWLQYSRTDIQSGQWWRFITGNWVHLTWRHWLMNALGLLAIISLYPNTLQIKSIWLALFWCCLAVTGGVWLLNPEIYMYVGLSGVLHGLLVVLIIADYSVNKHFLNLFLLFAVVVKLVWEGTQGPLPGSESMAGGNVIVQSHLYGFVGGLGVAAYMFIFNKNKKL